MKKGTTCKLALVLALLSLIINDVVGQNRKPFHIGIHAGYGTDYYQRKVKGPGGSSGAPGNFNSRYSVELGVYGEKFVKNRLSVVPKIRYSIQNVPTNTLCNCSHLDYLQKELHHTAWLALGLRAYLSQRSAVKAFAGMGVLTYYFVGYGEKRNDNSSFHWNAQGYNRINPGISGEIGLQWKRIGLSAEYHRNMGNTFAKGYKLSTGDEVRRSIFRQGYTISMSFLITKPASQ
ncbi:hypothetical protein GCM10010967_29610 [Dyadobacter beijingensis]|uniref:Outer membrane protein beta-barrel domain-containing protein n=1 Tax=Dyadobacter beijingensis TaxID=365489 RepID=A0ABQ2HXE8_9BACT|nr:hypothetical protein [Dyadobacter beijingensis]GGM94436.1 hypothetical protein GCM10010967_29610 [Dyadobacter beijingensis]